MINYNVKSQFGRFCISADGEDDCVELVGVVCAVRVICLHNDSAVSIGLKKSIDY